MTDDKAVIIICEPRKDCADPNPARWYCLRGHGAAPGVCQLKACGAAERPTGSGD